MRALQVTRDVDGTSATSVVDIAEDAMPELPVTVAVDYSTINYKDALALSGNPGVVKTWPLVPGIDLAGTVIASQTDEIAVGARVVLNGWEVGERHWGGLAERARVEPQWLTELPVELSTYDAAAIGTAGLTAMLSVIALEEHGTTPDDGPVVVTGAAGGLGSIAVALLHSLGFEVVAVSGRTATQADYLGELGASRLIDRDELAHPAEHLHDVAWSAGIDVAGSYTLANVLAATAPGGCVISCGLAHGMDLPTSVAPFILRGISLVGIDSVHAADRRTEAWKRLASQLDRGLLEGMTTEIGLDDVADQAELVLAGEIRGRLVVDVSR